MLSPTPDLEKNIDEFLAAPEAEALLYLPRCVTIAVNNSHTRRFGEPSKVLEAGEIATRVLNAKQFAHPLATTHCDQIAGLEALNRKDCPIERLWDQLSNCSAASSSVRGIQFRRESQNGHRDYAVEELTASIFASERPHVLRVAFVELPARVKVQSATPTAWDVSVEYQGRTILAKEGTLHYPRATPYEELRNRLQQALGILHLNGIEKARKFLGEVSGLYPDSNPQERVIIRELLAANNEGFTGEVSEASERMLDGPILTDLHDEIAVAIDAASADEHTLSYALESVRLLEDESLRRAAQRFNLEVGVRTGRDLRRYLTQQIRIFYNKTPGRLAEFDKILSALESEELQKQGWTKRPSGELTARALQSPS